MTSVLVIEDSVTVARVLMGALTGAGYEVRWVSTVREAMEAIRLAPPDILIIDHFLPDGEGSHIAEMFPFMHTIVVTSAGDQEVAAIREQVPRAALLRKPVEAQDLLTVLQGMVKEG